MSPSTETGATCVAANHGGSALAPKLCGRAEDHPIHSMSECSGCGRSGYEIHRHHDFAPPTAPEVEVRGDVRSIVLHAIHAAPSEGRERVADKAVDALTRLIDDRVQAAYSEGWHARDHASRIEGRTTAR